MSANTAVIICAAGSSSRFGAKKKKTFFEINKRAAFLRSVELFTDLPDVKQIILAISPEDEEMVKLKWGANLQFFGVKICNGGRERFETVKNALSLVKEDIDLVAVHDAARCCTKKEWIEECIKAAEKDSAAILASPVTATIKRVEKGKIVDTVDRSQLFEAQTPQIFTTDLIKKAYQNIDNLDKSKISDDSQLVEAIGAKVTIVKTDASNIKITTQSDIPLAEAILKSQKPKPTAPSGPFYEAQW
ncbi:MAG: 2-C-methyl-D-erythritol 4-phosphate cytidylyltransferase [Planctomycetes bacterium]|nr:2-C-methyl-D-erythritol 4-phosphate cytidylyltransferase [Planctomycetota bacterium]